MPDEKRVDLYKVTAVRFACGVCDSATETPVAEFLDSKQDWIRKVVDLCPKHWNEKTAMAAGPSEWRTFNTFLETLAGNTLA
jgi:hypothetical protein